MEELQKLGCRGYLERVQQPGSLRRLDLIFPVVELAIELIPRERRLAVSMEPLLQKVG